MPQFFINKARAAFGTMSDLAGPLVSCTDQCSFCDLVATGQNVINFITDLAVILGTGAIIIGGIMMIISGGSESRYGQAVKIIKTALQGVFILFAIGIGLNTLFYEILGQTGTWTEINCDGVRQITTSSGNNVGEVGGDTGGNGQLIEGGQTIDTGGGLNTTEGGEVTDVGGGEQVTAFPIDSGNQGGTGGEATIITTVPLTIESISEWIGEERPVVLRVAGGAPVEFRITRQNGEVVTDWQIGREDSGRQTLELPLETGAYQWQVRYQQNPEIVSGVGSFSVDRELPDGTATANINQQTGLVNVQGNFNDQGGSGLGNDFITTVEKKKNNDEWQAIETRTASFSDNQIEPGAAYKYRYTITDRAGNIKSIESNTVNYENMEAVVSIENREGEAPLTARINVRVSGNAAGTINYTVYCESPAENYDYKFDAVNDRVMNFDCRYGKVGTYAPLVIVEQSTFRREITDSVLAQRPAPNPIFGTTSWMTYGFNYYPLDKIDKVLEVMEVAGISVIRTDFKWFNIETLDSSQSLFNNNILIPDYDYDAVVNKIREHGIDILGLITEVPPWASSHPAADTYRAAATTNERLVVYGSLSRDVATELHNTAPLNNQDFENFAYKLANHFRGRVRYWEILSEPNLNSFFKDYRSNPRENHELYFEMLKAAYTGIKRADPSAVVVMGAVSGNGLTEGITEGQDFNVGGEDDFLRKLVQYHNGEVLNYFDVWNLHPYAWGLGNNERGNIERVRSKLTAFGAFLNELRGQYGVIANKPVWLGELGISSWWLEEPCLTYQPLEGCVGGLSNSDAENYRAEMAQRYYSSLPSEFPFIQKILWYIFDPSPTFSVFQNRTEEEGFTLAKWSAARGDFDLTKTFCDLVYSMSNRRVEGCSGE
mgnify:CR=1 FL=1